MGIRLHFLKHDTCGFDIYFGHPFSRKEVFRLDHVGENTGISIITQDILFPVQGYAVDWPSNQETHSHNLLPYEQFAASFTVLLYSSPVL